MSKSQLLDKVFQNGHDIFSYTQDVYLELSNLCNYADLHKACPVHELQKDKTILSSKIVYHVLDTLADHDYSKTIGFHTYNEPLIDPRLFEFIRYARQKCPYAEVGIVTNGYYLNQVLANELYQAGTTFLTISAYSDGEENRFKSIHFPMPTTVNRMKLDNRLDFYDTQENNCSKPCYSPLTQIIVTAAGRISLCCLDWRRQYCFGDLHTQTFEIAMHNEDMWLEYEHLSKGDRMLGLCKRCGWARGSVTSVEANVSKETAKAEKYGIPEQITISATDGTIRTLDIVEDLIEFTQLSRDQVHRLIRRKGYCARREFADCISREDSDHWFYLGSRYFLFENTIHTSDIDDYVVQHLPQNAKIWEFGGGTGNLSLALAAKGFDVSYSELSSLQKDFVRFRAHKYGLDIKVIEPWQVKPEQEFDLVLALDVLEHIPEYATITTELCKAVKQGGLVWETSAFEKDVSNITHRIADHSDYKKIFADQGFSREYGVASGKLWRRTSPARACIKPCQIDMSRFALDISNDHNTACLTWLRRSIEEAVAGNAAISFDYLQDAYELDKPLVKKFCREVLDRLDDATQNQLFAAANEITAKQKSTELLNYYIRHRNALTVMAQGLKNMKEAKWAESLNLLDKSAELDCGLHNVNYARAVVLAKMGNFQSARKVCVKELELQPQHTQSLELLGKIEQILKEHGLIESIR